MKGIEEFRTERVLVNHLSHISHRIGDYVLITPDWYTEEGKYKDQYCGEIRDITENEMVLVPDENESRGVGGTIPIKNIDEITSVVRPDTKRS